MADLSLLEQDLGYLFKDRSLLITSLTHSSYAHEKNTESYERLEFLGDAILDYLTGLILYEKYPDKKEGELTKLRASLVKEATLAKVAEQLSLTEYAFFSEGKQSNPIKQSSAVKCDLLEAVLGAILLDSDKNISLLKEIIIKILKPYFDEDVTDYKSILLEIFAQNKIDHKFIYEGSFDPKNPSYTAVLVVSDKIVSKGCGQNKRSAEAAACKIYYQNIFQK